MVRRARGRVVILVTDSLDHRARNVCREPEAFLVRLIWREPQGVDQVHLDEMVVDLCVLQGIRSLLEQLDGAVVVPLEKVAKAAGYVNVERVREREDLVYEFKDMLKKDGPSMLLVKVNEMVEDAGRVMLDPPDITKRFMQAIK